jgi:hypothetical protein
MTTDTVVMGGYELFDYQRELLEAANLMGDRPRICLYYRTGAGKSLTALVAIRAWGYRQVMVICPPSTHEQWREVGQRMGVHVQPMSHAKFRMKDTKLPRAVPVIADEMHMFGGQKAVGWRKLDRLAAGLDAPLVLASATPNYNDAERCYCVQHILDPHSCKGGYLQFLYTHCTTEQNPFGMEPIVTGFRQFPGAAEYLASLPNVFYLPDDLTYKIVDVTYTENVPDELVLYAYNRRKHRMVASVIEQMHTIRYQGLVTEDGEIQPEVLRKLLPMLVHDKPVLVYANHATVAVALSQTFDNLKLEHAVLTGQTTQRLKDRILDEFRAGKIPVLLGTATLATGTDGLDKVCDRLVILDDTDDDALRRQLIGRIMPRGAIGSTAAKEVIRFVPVSP